MFKKLVFILFLNLSFCEAVLSQEKLYIYAWSNSFPNSVLEKFTKETNIAIEHSSYDNNETMYAKVKLLANQPTYDIIFPSSYYIEKLLANDLLHKIDKSQITNYKFLSPSYLGLEFDAKNEYSIPFAIYFTGILYNKKYIKNPQQSWNELFRDIYKNKLLLIDDMREVFHIGLATSGHNANTKNSSEINEAYAKLLQLMPNIRLITAESIQSSFVSEEVWIGMCWNTEAIQIMNAKSNISFMFPQEGAIMSIDNFAILKNAKNVVNAHKFINFLLRPEISKEIIENIPITMPNKHVKQLLPSKLANNNALFPSQKQINKSILHKDLHKTNKYYLDLWEKLKIF